MKTAYYLFLVIVLIGCQKKEPVAQNAAEPEPHPESFTNWTTKSELFAEYLPLITGQTSRFAVHLTRLDTFKPLAKGKVEIRLTGADGKFTSYTTDAPSRPGIFGVDVKPSASGEFRVSISVTSDGLSDIHELGEMTVSPTKAAALHDHGPGGEERVAFLKEQQWTLDFATAIVEDRQLKASLRVPAEVLPRSGGEATVSVSFDGRLAPGPFPIAGARVSQGQILASLLPPTSAPSDLSLLELTKNESSLALQLARKDRERAERLVQSGAAPAKRLDEARTVEATAEARVKSAEARLAQYDSSSAADTTPKGVKPFVIRAPISGMILQANAAPGANVKSGDTLFKIVDADTVYVAAIVPEADFPQMRNLTGAEVEMPGTEKPRTIGPPVTVGRVVDPQSRTFQVVYQLDNRDRQVAIHQSLYVRLLTKASNVAPAIPESALVDDAGRPIVFIQASGEGFIRRPVKLGIREGGYVEVVDGVFPGERVVIRGAHLVRLATMSSQVPAHGHVH